MWWQSNTTIKISIHALLAESDHFATLKFVNPYISIHALLAESDTSSPVSTEKSSLFLSTLSLRRATHSFFNIPSSHNISIHALLAESDGKVSSVLPGLAISIHALLAESDFGTLPRCLLKRISIHALLAESDE